MSCSVGAHCAPRPGSANKTNTQQPCNDCKHTSQPCRRQSISSLVNDWSRRNNKDVCHILGAHHSRLCCLSDKPAYTHPDSPSSLDSSSPTTVAQQDQSNTSCSWDVLAAPPSAASATAMTAPTLPTMYGQCRQLTGTSSRLCCSTAVYWQQASSHVQISLPT